MANSSDFLKSVIRRKNLKLKTLPLIEAVLTAL